MFAYISLKIILLLVLLFILLFTVETMLSTIVYIYNCYNVQLKQTYETLFNAHVMVLLWLIVRIRISTYLQDISRVSQQRMKTRVPS